MLGAIIGDIVGSRFEFNPTNDYNFELFTNECSFTDDTICTIAIADALLKRCDFGKSLQQWCRRYPHPMGGYGNSFRKWVHSSNPQPYNSFGNGAAMRISPIAWFGLNAIGDMSITYEATACTHNHPEGIKGAQSVMTAIHDCLQMHHLGCEITRENIWEIGLKRAVEHFGYNINLSLNEVQNRFDETCQGTVPVAFWIILQSNSFEDAIRRAVSLGADADTLGAIVGSIAEAIWGIPEWMKRKAISYLPQEMRDVLNAFRKACPWKLTQHIKQNKLRAKLLSSCRFYKGEDSCPEILESFNGMHDAFWEYERFWVLGELQQDKEYKEAVRYFQTYVQKGKPLYNAVPLGLQAIFANRIEHWGGDGTPVSLDNVNRFCALYEHDADEYESRLNQNIG